MMNPMMMPMQSKPTYTFTTQLVRDVRGQEPGMIMQGKVDNEGKVDGILVKKLTNNLSMKVTGSFPSSNVDQGFFGLDFDFEDKNAQHNFKFGPGHFGFSMMQRVHQQLMLGFDYAYLVLVAWSVGQPENVVLQLRSQGLHQQAQSVHAVLGVAEPAQQPAKPAQKTDEAAQQEAA